MKSNRIEGIDLARALAIIGMIIVNFKVAFNAILGNQTLVKAMDAFDGKAAALFIILAGVGLSLMTNTARLNNDKLKMKKARVTLLKRASFLFVLGLLYFPVWPADILHYYGFFIFFGVLMIKAKNWLLWTLSIVLVAVYSGLVFIFDYETSWDWKYFEYIDFWTVSGFLRNLVFNGFHPLIPWVAFLFFGIWLGRQNLKDKKFRKRAIIISSIIFVTTVIISRLSLHISSDILVDWTKEDLIGVFGTTPMPPMPYYMISSTSLAVVIIAFSIYLAERFKESTFMIGMLRLGRLALTMYLAHVIIGMGVVMEFTGEQVTWNIEYSLIHALIFSVLAAVFSYFWLKKRKLGPLEFVMRKLS